MSADQPARRRRGELPPPTVPSALAGPAGPANRFTNPLAETAPPAPAPAHTAHTRRTPPAAEPAAERRGEPDGMVRRTYYYSERVADALGEAVDRIHYDSRGRIPKHVALDAIIEAGVGQVDAIARRLLGRA
jgi:hypothetical protein